MRPPGHANAQPPSDQQSRASLLRTVLGARPDCRLFRAEFQYLPVRDSPNENPHVELALHPGELLLVHGPMDEDRFYWGETLDGRAGLVPSNFVQRVPDSELRELLQQTTATAEPRHNCPAMPSTSAAALVSCCMEPSSQFNSSAENHQRTNSARRPESPSFALTVPQHLTRISHDFSDFEQQPKAIVLPDSQVCPYPPADVSRVSVQELRGPDQLKVSNPRELQVERRLSRSLLLSWLPPEGGGGPQKQPISQYQVCVDGQVRAVVPGSFKCRALLEDLDLDKFINVSVRAVGADGQASADAACTLAVGAEAPVAPQHVRISQVTPTSAQLSWYPSNSGAEHVILLNALKVGVCPAGVFQVQLNGLTPSTIYRLSVRTKHPRAVLEKRPVERCVDFKTLPKIGLPDPPQDVQAEAGPQPGTLLISWRPNTTQPRPPSRAAVHGYLIYADGRCIAQVPGSNADHVLLRLADFADDPPVFITVRTRTREGTVSADSNVVRVPRAGGNDHHLLLSSSLPSHLLGQLVTSNGRPSAAQPAANHSPMVAQLQQSQQQPGLLLMTAALQQQQPKPSAADQQNGPRWEAAGQGQQLGANSSSPLISRQTLATKSQQHQHQQQYFTFHPKALDKEFPRLDERPDVLAMEQNYLLRHQQRQRMRSSTPDRRSFPLANRSRAAILPGAISQPSQQQFLPGPMDQQQRFGGRPVPLQLARLQQNNGGGYGGFPAASSTRSEPDLRPSQVAAQEESRWFVAIQDHQPSLAAADELPFRRHQLVKVYGDVDSNGCFWAEVRGRYGLVPAGKLVEIAKDDLFLAAEQRKPGGGEGGMASRSQQQQQQPWPAEPSSSQRRMRWGSIKSRSYEHAAEAGSQYRQYRSFMAGSDQEAGSSQQQWHTNSLLSERQSRGGYAAGGPRVERRLSAVESASHQPQTMAQTMMVNNVAHAGGSGYRLPSLNGARTTHGSGNNNAWRQMPAEEEMERVIPSFGQHDQQLESQGPPLNSRAQQQQQQQRMGGEEFIEDGDEPFEDQPPNLNQHSLRAMPSQLMVAKYDYDSRQLSPNVDAEQVELSFRQGDMITVYGPMDDDGFYLGELNGVRGLVPSNFLQPAAEHQRTQARPKGVVFSSDLGANDGAAAWPPNSAQPKPLVASGRRGGTQQPTTAGPAAARLTGSTGMTSKAFKVAGIAPTAPGKPLTKKSSDLSAKALQQQPTGRKGSQARGGGQGGPPGALKRKG